MSVSKSVSFARTIHRSDDRPSARGVSIEELPWLPEKSDVAAVAFKRLVEEALRHSEQVTVEEL